MSSTISVYTIFYFGKPMSFSHEAALKARHQVSEYLSRAQGTPPPPEGIAVKHEATHEGLAGLAKISRTFCVVPVSNSKLGDVYDFMPFRSYQMIGEVALPVVVIDHLRSSFFEL